MGQVRQATNYLIAASLVLGVVLLAQIYTIPFLFVAVLVEWLAYVAVAILVARRKEIAYPIAFALAILTLGLSVPNPTHQNMLLAGFSLGAITFLAGSILQVGVVTSFLLYYFLKRRQRLEVLVAE